MKIALILATMLTTASMPTAAFAADCVVTTTRTACPGKESESYSKCPNNAKSCSATTQVLDAKACADAALKSCANTRFDVTKYKAITAKFGGVDFARGQDFCNRDGATSDGSYKYIVRDNFPHRDSVGCN